MNASKTRLDQLDLDIITWALDRYLKSIEEGNADLPALREAVQELGEHFYAKQDENRRDEYSRFNTKAVA